MKITTCLLFVALAITASAYGEEYDQSIDCDRVDIEGGDRYELSQCEGRAKQEVEFQLRQLLKQVLSTIESESGKEALLESQRRWLKWRESEADVCAHLNGYTPIGSMYGTVKGACMTSLTHERIRSLRKSLRNLPSY